MRNAPPPFLGLAGHPVRWHLLSELARSDRRVRELTAALGQPQSLVSYHLGRLRSEGLVTARRSSADGRDAYYRADLARCGELLEAAGAALHPALGRTAASPPLGRRGSILFLCTGNSARSQMAEALTRHRSEGRVQAFSAGSRPKELHPDAVEAMRELGIDIAGRRTKHLEEFLGQRFDYVVSLCDRVREVCPEFPGAPELVHWSVPDPAAEGVFEAFRRTAAELDTRIRFLLHAIEEVTRT